MKFKLPIAPFLCKDGTKLSVQASSSHYCTPRNDDGPYTHVEVGFPSNTYPWSVPPESWKEYADDSFPSEIYGWVPIEVVNEYIESHGGIDFIATFNKIQDMTRKLEY